MQVSEHAGPLGSLQRKQCTPLSDCDDIKVELPGGSDCLNARGICGSNITWSGSKQFADWVSVAVATLDTPFSPKGIRQSHTDSRACWLESSQGTDA
jgi:hypothetical protein|tara:strand:+ start:1069 stop:1359 length:291 start_codon:yes stop_codon:yes gene_type:complete